MRAALLLPLLLLPACAAAPPIVSSQLRASDVVELAALPPGYERGAQLSATCHGTRGFRAIDQEPLDDVDCSFQRLTRSLHAQAAERELRSIVGKQCDRRGGADYVLRCTAALALPTSQVALGAAARQRREGPAPSPARVLDLDEPFPQHSGRIRVSFVPRPGARVLPPRTYQNVEETALAAVGRAPLGQVKARCEGCEPMALRHALRVTAGRMGAGQVAEVSCFADGDERHCRGAALEPWSY